MHMCVAVWFYILLQHLSISLQMSDEPMEWSGFKSKSIGLIVPSLADSFFAICANSINMVAQEHGYSMILTASSDNVETELSEAQWMLQKHVEGLLVCPARTGSRFADPLFQHIPIVSFDRPMLIPYVPCVLVENYAGARRGTEHLIQEHDHERIHFLGDSKHLYSIQTRLSGYKHALSKARLLPQATLECSSEEVIFDVVSRLLEGKQPPTAFFCGNENVNSGLPVEVGGLEMVNMNMLNIIIVLRHSAVRKIKGSEEPPSSRELSGSGFVQFTFIQSDKPL